MSQRRRAVLLTFHQPPILTSLVDALDNNGFDVALIVTGRGPNFAIPDGAYDKMGAQIAAVFDAYDFPILIVKSVSQAQPAILAADAELVLCLGFPYRITEALLSTKMKFVNIHPAPLPLLAGPSPFVWPVLRPDLYPLEHYSVAVHYMTPVLDEGRLIMQAKIRLPEGVTAENVTTEQIQAASYKVVCETVDEVVRLVKTGYEGVEADSIPAGYTPVRRLTDEDRTISRETTIEEADRLWRAIGHGAQKPLFRNEHGLFRLNSFRKLDVESAEAAKAAKQPSGAYRKGTRTIQSLKDGYCELDIRKL